MLTGMSIYVTLAKGSFSAEVLWELEGGRAFSGMQRLQRGLYLSSYSQCTKHSLSTFCMVGTQTQRKPRQSLPSRSSQSSWGDRLKCIQLLHKGLTSVFRLHREHDEWGVQGTVLPSRVRENPPRRGHLSQVAPVCRNSLGRGEELLSEADGTAPPSSQSKVFLLLVWADGPWWGR